jgi:Flp pilus assembly protein TadD/SAM-dependent methyltransferase
MMSGASSEKSFHQAVALHEQGRLDQAEQCYRAILSDADRNHVGALHNLGILCLQRHDYDNAVVFTREAVRQQPDLSTAHGTLAIALKHLGRLAEAERCCREALRLDPGYAEAHNIFGDLLIGLGRFAEAENSFREALRLMPDYTEAHNNLGIVLLFLEQPAEAEICFRTALRLKPGNASALSNLGMALILQRKLSEGAACFGRAASNLDNATVLMTWFRITGLFCSSSDHDGVAAFEELIPKRLRPQIRRAFAEVPFTYCCPFCDARLRMFLPHGFDFPVLKEKRVVGGGYRPNVLCVVCGSFDRERLVYLYLLQKTDLLRHSLRRVLHVAPERQLQHLLSTAANIDYYSADIAFHDVMVRVDITKIPFPDASFDVIVCNHVLEHIMDDRKAMRELHRVLKAGGWAILQVPVSLTLTATYGDPSITTRRARETAFGQHDHVRIYATDDYVDRLSEAGFAVEVFNWAERPDEFGGVGNRFGLNTEESVYIARSVS